MSSQIQRCTVVKTRCCGNQRVSFPMTDRITHPGGIGIVWKRPSVSENLSIDGLIFVENDDELRRLNDLHRKRETRNSRFRSWGQTLDSVCVLPKILGALLVHSCGPR